MSRRTSRTRDVFSSCPDARWKRRLNCSFLSFTSCSSSWSGLKALISSAFMASASPGRSVLALDDARLDRKLGGAQPQRLARDRLVDAVELEHDAAGLDAGHPQLRRALARAHPHLGRLLG